MTTRNAGLQIHDLNLFQNTTLIIFSLLMFIGCSPSSVGGGIRTTTIAIIGLYLYSFLKMKMTSIFWSENRPRGCAKIGGRLHAFCWNVFV